MDKNFIENQSKNESPEQGCKIVKDVKIFESKENNHMLVWRTDQSDLVRALEIEDNASGIFRDRPLNAGIASMAEGKPTHYVVSDALMDRPFSDGGAYIKKKNKSDDLEMQDHTDRLRLNGLDAKVLNHTEVLKEIGIECQKNGVSVAPVLSTDDIRAMAKAAPEHIKNDRERDTGR